MRKTKLIWIVGGLGLILTVVPAGARAVQPDGETKVASAKHSAVLFTDEGKPIHVFRLNPDAADARAPQASNDRDPSWDLDDDEDELNNGAAPGTNAAGGNLIYHKGPVILQAREVSLFWGNWSGSDVPAHMQNFFSQFGTSNQYVTITQYYNSANAHIQVSSLGGLNRFDTSTPPSTVTDSGAQQQIAANFANGNLGTPDASTVYFLYLPSGVKSTIGSSSSCTSYCGYHSNFTYNGVSIKYAVMPFPSCTGCQGSAQSGLSIAAASLTITSGHEMREAATDALGTAWYDRRGYEADDKCAWQLFVANGFQHQKEWSNAVSGCVQGGITGP